MTLRTRLFLLISGVVAAVVAGQWWLTRSLAQDVQGEVGAVAFSVGEQVVTGLVVDARGLEQAHADLLRRVLPELDCPPGESEATEHGEVLTRRFVWHAQAKGQSPVVLHEEVERHVDGERVEHRVVGPTATAAAPAATPAKVRVMELKVDSQASPRVLQLTGDGVNHRIPIPQVGIDRALESFQGRLLVGSLALLGAGLVVAGFVAHRASAPLRRLAQAARAVGAGGFGVQVDAKAGGEVREAVAAFNRMSLRLAELDEAARRLREREHLQELGEVARALAHGMRNPLNALGLSLEELATMPLEREAERLALATSARAQMRRIDGSIRQFLALASSGDAAAAAPVDVVALVEDVVLEVLQDVRGRVRIRVETAGSVPPLRGVAAELRATVQALVVNAVEASADGAGVIVRATAEDGGSVRVEVVDEGAGLPPEVRDRLFTPHVTTKASGSGIGLFLAHRIATARHGGSLEMLDAEPHGTRAVLVLRDARGNGHESTFRRSHEMKRADLTHRGRVLAATCLFTAACVPALAGDTPQATGDEVKVKTVVVCKDSAVVKGDGVTGVVMLERRAVGGAEPTTELRVLGADGGDATVVDVSGLEVGESRTVTTAAGKTIEITRTEAGLSIDADGKQVEVALPEAGADVIAGAGLGDVHVMKFVHATDGDAAVAGDVEKTVIVRTIDAHGALPGMPALWAERVDFENLKSLEGLEPEVREKVVAALKEILASPQLLTFEAHVGDAGTTSPHVRVLRRGTATPQ